MRLALISIVLASQLQLNAAVQVDYKSIINDRGDTLPDFSFCGYHASDDQLPSNTGNATVTLQATSGDQQSRIQSALNNVSSSGGGVVLLGAGTFALRSNITIPTGTVLRGSGINQTIITSEDASFSLINIGAATGDAEIGVTANITDSYVPIGASNISVSSTSGFEVGQLVYVQREVTQNWINAQGMGNLTRSGKHETWLAAGTILSQPRSIKSISGTTITLDVPLTDYVFNEEPFSMNGQLASYTPPSTPKEMGLEDFSIQVSPSCSNATLDDTSCSSTGIIVTSWTTDSWIRNLDMTGLLEFINIQQNAKQITITDVVMNRDQASDGTNGWPSDIAILGSQVLVANSATHGASGARTFSVSTMSRVAGPNAVVNHSTDHTTQTINTHERWAQGLLVDSSSADIVFQNRGILGSGQGWTMNSGVAWNTTSTTVYVQSAPNGTNYCIGCKYDSVTSGSNGTFLYDNEDIDPPSLFAAQLAARGIN